MWGNGISFVSGLIILGGFDALSDLGFIRFLEILQILHLFGVKLLTHDLFLLVSLAYNFIFYFNLFLFSLFSSCWCEQVFLY